MEADSSTDDVTEVEDPLNNDPNEFSEESDEDDRMVPAVQGPTSNPIRIKEYGSIAQTHYDEENMDENNDECRIVDIIVKNEQPKAIATDPNLLKKVYCCPICLG